MLQDLLTKLAWLKEQIDSKVSHPYLLQNIQSPHIDEDKLLLILSMLKVENISNEKLDSYVITTMLIQMALDTHEHVSNRSSEEEKFLKNQQLTVLAGDYYSGLYYKYLADMDDIAMIKVLAEGIKDVNENKILVYQSEPTEITRLMECLKKVEASLFLKISNYLQIPLWQDFVSNVLLFKRLLVEKRQFLNNESSVLFNGLKKCSFPHFNLKEPLSKEQTKLLIRICDRYMDHMKVIIEKNIKQLPFVNELLEQRVHQILDQHYSLTKTYVEEG